MKARVMTDIKLYFSLPLVSRFALRAKHRVRPAWPIKRLSCRLISERHWREAVTLSTPLLLCHHRYLCCYDSKACAVRRTLSFNQCVPVVNFLGVIFFSLGGKNQARPGPVLNLKEIDLGFNPRYSCAKSYTSTNLE